MKQPEKNRGAKINFHQKLQKPKNNRMILVKCKEKKKDRINL